MTAVRRLMGGVESVTVGKSDGEIQGWRKVAEVSAAGTAAARGGAAAVVAEAAVGLLP